MLFSGGDGINSNSSVEFGSVAVAVALAADPHDMMDGDLVRGSNVAPLPWKTCHQDQRHRAEHREVCRQTSLLFAQRKFGSSSKE